MRRATLAEARARLPRPATPKWPLGVWDAEALAHGTMSVSLFAPKEADFQTPHDQDELYIVMAGRGRFVAAGESFPFGPGDVLFVPAGEEHRFTEFSPDSAAWVVFYGPRGGEAEAAGAEGT